MIYNTGFILFILADIILLIFLITWLMKYQNKKARSRTMKEFDDYVLKHNLILDRTQTLNKNIIGLDREHLKLIFLDRKNKLNPVRIHDLEGILSCKTIKSRKTENSHIKNISLEIIYQNPDKEIIVLPFYQEGYDQFYKMMRLAKKAHFWEKTINLYKGAPTRVQEVYQ
ncbi:MAG: hypothetical protein ABIN48_04685 [Ginsengibacter sp.]